jgi:hypothetical protein
MTYELPAYIWVLKGVSVLGMPAMLGIALYRGATAAGVARRAALLLGLGTVGALVGWVIAAAVLAGLGAFRFSSTAPVPRVLVVDVAVIAALLLAARLPIIRRSLGDHRAPARLALVHTFRIQGIVFVLVMLLGGLPAVFALPAGLGDLAIGIAAPFVAAGVVRREGYGRGVWEFNLIGILDLVVAGTIAVMVPRFGVAPSTAALGLLPLAVVPAAQVPLAVAVHLLSLDRIRRSRAARPIPAIERPAASRAH